MHTIPFNLEPQERLAITPAKLSKFCQHRQIKELALFGSVLRDDFHPNSDIDMLITFQPNAKVSLLDLVDIRQRW